MSQQETKCSWVELPSRAGPSATLPLHLERSKLNYLCFGNLWQSISITPTQEIRLRLVLLDKLCSHVKHGSRTEPVCCLISLTPSGLRLVRGASDSVDRRLSRWLRLWAAAVEELCPAADGRTWRPLTVCWFLCFSWVSFNIHDPHEWVLCNN